MKRMGRFGVPKKYSKIKAMKIALVADMHYGKDINYPNYKGVDYVNNLGKTLKDKGQEVSEHLKKYDLVVNLGDVFANQTHENDRENFREALKFLGDLGRPVIHVIGNHESHRITHAELAEDIGQAHTYYSLDAGGFHHVVLHTVRESESSANPYLVGDEQMKWLAEDLKETALKTLVYVHVPIDEQSLADNYYFSEHPERGLVENRKEIRAVLEAQGNVLAVFSGHLHFYHMETINGIPYITVPSISENDGAGKPFMQYLSVALEGEKISFETVKI